MKLGLIWITGFFLVSCGLASRKSKSYGGQYPIGSIRHLVVNLKGGDVFVARTDADLATVEVEEFTGPVNLEKSKCDVTLRQDGERLIIENKGSRIGNCEIKLQVQVAEDTKADIDTGTGDVRITGLKPKEIKASTGSGNIKLSETGGALDLDTGSGDISVDGLDTTIAESEKQTLNASLKTGSGDIDFDFNFVPAAGKLHIRTGSGDVAIAAPRDTALRLDFKTGAGDRKGDAFPIGDDAAFHVDVETGSGDLELRKK